MKVWLINTLLSYVGSVFLFVGVGSLVIVPVASAFTENDYYCTTSTTGCFYDPSAQQCSTGDESSVALVGSDNEQKTWNYFRGKGLSEKQVAGIMGNMLQESHFDPQIMEIGGRSKDPFDALDKGWGIIQWSGNGGTGRSTGEKFNRLKSEASVSGKSYVLATQLEMVWEHMHNHGVVTQQFDFDYFSKINDEVEAAIYFGEKIEGFGVAGGRFDDATVLYNKYKGTGGSTNPSPSNASSSDNCGDPGSSQSSTPECGNATGNAVILCEAKKYDPVDYVWGGGHAGGAAYHQACPKIRGNDSKCGLDCSGLVSVAIYDAFKNSAAWSTTTIVSDTKNWKEISYSQLKAGDVIEPDAGHVEIVDHVSNGTIYTFGAHTAKTAQAKQVGPSQYNNSGGNRYFRYIGQGAQS